MSSSDFSCQVPDPSGQSNASQRNRRGNSSSFSALVIFILSAVQSVSGACLAMIHAYKQARDTIKKANQNPVIFPLQPRIIADAAKNIEPLKGPILPLNFAVSGMLETQPGVTDPLHSLPPPVLDVTPTLSRTASSVSESLVSSTAPSRPRSPALDYVYPPLELLMTILTPPPSPAGADVRGSFSTILALRSILSLISTAFSPTITRLLPYLLYTHILSYTRLMDIVRLARVALFPEGWPAPPPVDPTPEQQVLMREELGRRLLECTPGTFLLRRIVVVRRILTLRRSS